MNAIQVGSRVEHFNIASYGRGTVEAVYDNGTARVSWPLFVSHGKPVETIERLRDIVTQERWLWVAGRDY